MCWICPFTPFLLWKCCELQWKGGSCWKCLRTPAGSSPWRAGLQEGPGLSLHPTNRLSSQRMQGGYHGRGYLIPERKKVQRCEWLYSHWVLGSEICSSQALSSGRVQWGSCSCCLCVQGWEAWAICIHFPKAATGSDLWKEIFPPWSALILSSASLESQHRWSYSLVWGWVLGHVSSFF